MHLPQRESSFGGAPRGLTEPPPRFAGTSGTCLDPRCLWCADCPSCLGGTARIPTDFQVVHHADGALTACCTCCQGSGTRGRHPAGQAAV